MAGARWTPEERALAARLRDEEGKKLKEIAHAMGRTIFQVVNHFRRKKERDLTLSGKSKTAPKKVTMVHMVMHHEPTPPEVLCEWEYRRAAPRTLHMVLCGDPLPGQSAWDKMDAESRKRF